MNLNSDLLLITVRVLRIFIMKLKQVRAHPF